MISNNPMSPKTKTRRVENGFDRTVESFADMGADSIFLTFVDGIDGMVCGEPCDSKAGTTWSMSLMSSIDEAKKCKYPKVCRSDDEKMKKLLSTFPVTSKKKK